MLHPSPDAREAYTTHAQWAVAATLVRGRPPQSDHEGVTLLDPTRSGFGEDDRVLAAWADTRRHDGNPEGVDYTTLVAIHSDGSFTLLSAGSEPAASRIRLRDVRLGTARRWLWLGEQYAAHALRSDLTMGAHA